jgi:hypothetical protein
MTQTSLLFRPAECGRCPESALGNVAANSLDRGEQDIAVEPGM